MAVSGNGSHSDEVESLFTSPCWSSPNSNLQSDFIETQKLMLENPAGLGSDKLLLEGAEETEIATKVTMDALDNLLLNPQPINTSLAELKPLPPFAGYTANLSINGIQVGVAESRSGLDDV